MGGKGDDGGSNQQQQQMDSAAAQKRYSDQQALLRQQQLAQATPVEQQTKLPVQEDTTKKTTPQVPAQDQQVAPTAQTAGLGDQLVSGLAQGQIAMNPDQIAQVPGLKVGQPPTTAQV
jgi:hypothetical protein